MKSVLIFLACCLASCEDVKKPIANCKLNQPACEEGYRCVIQLIPDGSKFDCVEADTQAPPPVNIYYSPTAGEEYLAGSDTAN